MDFYVLQVVIDNFDLNNLITIISSVIGGIIAGLFTYLGVRATIKHDEKKRRQDECQKAINERPRLEIVNYLDVNDFDSLNNEPADVEVLIAEIKGYIEENGMIHPVYDNGVLENNLVFVEYELKNTGVREIEELCLVNNYQDRFASFPMESRNHFVRNKVLNFENRSNKRHVKKNEIIKIRILSVDEKTLKMVGGISVFITDIFGVVWSQFLHSPNNDIEISRLSSNRELRDATDVSGKLDFIRDSIKK